MGFKYDKYLQTHKNIFSSQYSLTCLLDGRLLPTVEDRSMGETGPWPLGGWLVDETNKQQVEETRTAMC